MGVIYKIINPSGKIYVGQTVDYEKRIKRYRWLACVKQRMLYSSFKKHGFNSHIFEIIEDNVPVELLNERERYWIGKLSSFYKYNREYGMNLNEGGNTPIWDKQRIENFADKFRGSLNPFFGKSHSEENIRKFSENTKEQLRKSGYKISKEATRKGQEARRRPIVVFNIDGSIYAEFISLTECAKHFKVDITTVRDSLRGCKIRSIYKCEYKTAPRIVGEQSFLNGNN